MRFLGSIHFAIALIVSTALFVIVGTFLEAWSDSHLFAAHWIYNNPVFLALLWGYFINIFVSTCLRYPFKKKHIPFIITHIGLLMLFGGALIKGHFGTQGVMALTEGSGSDQIMLPQTFALRIETREGITQLPLSPKKRGKLYDSEELTLTLIDWRPHAQDHFEGWISGEQAHLFGFPPLPVHDWSGGELPLSLRTPEYTLSALRSADIKGVAERLTKSSVALVRTFDEQTYLLAKNGGGELFEQELNDDLVVLFDHGYQGYGVMAELPPTFPEIDLIAPLIRKSEQQALPRKKEEATPQIRLLARQGEQQSELTLTYDPHAESLSSPLFGTHLLRFQPQAKKIPSHLRLRQTRQINYPDSEKPFSYESDLWIDGQEETISMNRVHQTGQGYRFYMSGISHRPFAKSAHIIVNQDPAKYILTYPGGIVLTLGMLLLYLKRCYA